MPRKTMQPKTTKLSTKAPKVPKTPKAPKVPKVPKVTKSKTAKAQSVKKNKKGEEKGDPEVSDVESEETVETEETGEPVKKTRRVPTRETVDEEFTGLVASINEEILRLRESQVKTKGVKFLRSLGKRVKTLHGHAGRVMKQKKKTKRKNNQNSGFLKPVMISKDMAKFTGWDPEGLRSRVDVTKYLCNYIKENDLQNPADRRQIMADKKLQKLLGYNPKTDEPLTYYRIQTYMKNHFTNPPKKEE
jgi:upstream activation factor subunit UAF30